MKVVSNASPLINLARVDLLHLLPSLFQEVVVPRAVYDEIVTDGVGQPGSREVGNADWIVTRSVEDRFLVQALRQELDAGESEAIVLAIESGADLLLMDERLGRDVAHHFGIRYMGLVGVLTLAKHNRLIESLRVPLTALRETAHFRLSATLIDRILRDEGEM